MLPVALENLFVGVVGLAMLLYLGVGLCAWLPSMLAPYRLFLAPWAGYCLLVIITQYLTNSPLALTALQSVFVALGAATVVNGFVLWRNRESGVGNRLMVGKALRLPIPDSRLLLAISLVTFALCLLPIWSYGYNTVIGENWDAEIYLGLGEYLKGYAQASLHSALPNPILDTLVNPPYGLRTHGFSYFQAALGFLPLDSLNTLAPILALLRALAIPAAYVFFREGLGLGSRPALWASAALGLNAFLLWVTYNTFGMQVPTFGLLPFAACLFMVTLRVAKKDDCPWRCVVNPAVWTGLALAGIAVTYHPALTAFVALAGLPALVLLVTSRGTRGRILVAIGVAALSGIVLSLVSQLKSLDGFLKQYSEQTGGLGLTGFTSPADAFGLSLSFRDLIPSDPGRALLTLVSRLYGLASWLALVVVLASLGVYVYGVLRTPRGEERHLAWARVALVAGALIYVLLFLRPLNYPYGWFKALSFVSFVLVGAVVGGLWFFVGKPGTARFGGWTRRVAYLAGGGVLVLVLLTTCLTVARYWGEPLRYSSTMLEASAVRGVVAGPQGQGDGSVYISNSPNMRQLGRLYNGILSYFLRDTDLYGTFDTANSKLDREKSSGVYRYTLLHADDDPAEYGVGGAKLAWQNPLLSLYALPPEEERIELYHHNFRNDGSYPGVSDAGSVRFALDADSLALSKDANPQVGAPLSEPRQVTLGLSSFTTATVGVNIPDGSASGRETQIVVPPGYTVYRSPEITSTGMVTLAHAGRDQEEPGSNVDVRWSHLDRYTGGSGQEGLSSGGPGLMVSAGAAETASGILTKVLYLNNRPSAVSQTLSLDIYGAGGGNTGHYGYWNVNVPANRSVNLGLSLDPTNKTLTLDSDSSTSALSDTFKGDTGDGTYTASLLIYENGQVSDTLNDIFRFEIKDGKLASLTPRNLPTLYR